MSPKTQVKVLLLAAGESTRFWPLKEKNTWPFLGKPLLRWHYEQLARLGFPAVILVGNAQNRDLLLKVAPPANFKIDFVVQEGKGQVQAVWAARERLDEGAVLVLNASDFYDDDFLEQLLRARRRNPQAIYLGAIRTKNYFPGGYLLPGPNNSVAAIVEKPSPGKEPSDIVRLVADLFPQGKALVYAVSQTKDSPEAGYEQAINHLIVQGSSCLAVLTDVSSWQYLKYPWHTLEVMDGFLQKIKGQTLGSNIKIEKNVILEGPLLIEDNVKIMEYTKIVGPCYIGRDTIVGNHSLIRQSHLGQGCVTGFATEITRSFIGSNCWFHRNYIGDSVLEADVGMGSGAVLANFRLDEREIPSQVAGIKIKTGRFKLG
ncbi:MAG: sugar phosphate nucleotidyltransferase, partial [Patescibacteria group bacterium]